jgi:hypothetical protein
MCSISNLSGLAVAPRARPGAPEPPPGPGVCPSLSLRCSLAAPPSCRLCVSLTGRLRASSSRPCVRRCFLQLIPKLNYYALHARAPNPRVTYLRRPAAV